MKLKITACIIGLISLYDCTSAPSVTVLCEKDTKGNYILKWEMFPEIDNTPVEIYVAENDSIFPSSPEMTVSSNDYMAVIKNMSDRDEKRKYFRIKVGGVFSGVVSNRFFELDSVQNFRDIGGYLTNDHRSVRWGKIFRSGSLFKMTPHDSTELNSIGVKTVIDLRSEDVKKANLNRYTNVSNVRIPIAHDGYNSITQKVMDGFFLRGDAIIHTQDTYKDMITNFAAQYASFFDYLCDERNYPVVFHCYLGKDQSGLATYFLLRALDVPMDIIEDDYMASGTGIDRSKLVKNADSLTESRQEAMTMLTKTDLLYLRYGIACIREKSGSEDDYMLNELNLTPEKRKKLKDILLH